MKEQEIRNRIRCFIDGFDRATAAVRKGVRKVVLPATLGMGLAIGPGCGVDDADRTVNVTDSGSDIEKNVALYAAPFPSKTDAGPDGMNALYAAPFPTEAGPVPQDDGGAHALYAAPFPTEAGPVPQDDGGAHALYAAPFPTEAGPVPQDDGGAHALYAAPFPDPDAAA